MIASRRIRTSRSSKWTSRGRSWQCSEELAGSWPRTDLWSFRVHGSGPARGRFVPQVSRIGNLVLIALPQWHHRRNPGIEPGEWRVLLRCGSESFTVSTPRQFDLTSPTIPSVPQAPALGGGKQDRSRDKDGECRKKRDDAGKPRRSPGSRSNRSDAMLGWDQWTTVRFRESKAREMLIEIH